jgi:hypothetical protein
MTIPAAWLGGFAVTENWHEIWEIFFPYAAGKTHAVREHNTRFAYYTTADTALKILRNREIWMRNARTMNDFEEIAYGRDMVVNGYKSEAGKVFQSALNALFPGFSAGFEKRFDQWLPLFLTETFITSFSEHADHEDDLGRLSMWRAYGKQNGVALIASNAVFMSSTDSLGIYSSPVAYLTQAGMEKELTRVTQNIVANRDKLLAAGVDEIQDHAFNMFQFAVMCIKHPGFHEEREWRAIWSPTFGPNGKHKTEVECIGGVPQAVLKVPLVDYPNEGIVGLSPATLINRVIVGPTEYGGTIRDALAAEMAKAGIPSPASRIVVSDIPLRT